MPLLGLMLRTLLLAPRIVIPFWCLGLCLLTLGSRSVGGVTKWSVNVARRNLVLSCLVLSAALYAPQVRAACTALNASDHLPQTIATDQCFELQGGNVLTGHYQVAGQLFLKAGRSTTLAPGSTITVAPGGLLEPRGQLELKANAQIVVQGKLNNSGLMYFNSPSILQAQDHATMRNIGRLVFTPGAYVRLAGHSTLSTSGILTLNNALLTVTDAAAVTNQGTIQTEQQALLNFQGKSTFTNRGSLELNPYATLAFKEHSHFTNKNTFTPRGTITISATALWHNDALVKQAPESKLTVSDHAQIRSEHTIELSGTLTLSQSARFLNQGTLALKPNAQLTARDYAVIINDGTFRNDDAQMQLEQAGNFVNQNIVSGQQSRERIKAQQQHH